MARLLLVDDDNDIRELGRALLSHAGHDVQVAGSAMAAMQLLRHGQYDLLITDANMPTHSGFDLLKMVRADQSLDDLTTVMLTGRRERQDVEAAVGAGVNAYIVKPLDPMLFIEKINELISKRAVEDPWSADFSSVAVNEVASGRVIFEMTSLSPLGVHVRTTQPLRPGAVIEVDSDLFPRIGILPQRMRVFACREATHGASGHFEARLTFVDLSDEARQILKEWTNNGGRRGRTPRTKAS